MKFKYSLLAIGLLLSTLFLNIESVYAETVYYSVATSTSTDDLAMGNHPTEDYTFAGEEIATGSSLAGLEFNRMRAYLSHALAGNPTGVIRAGVWNSTTIPTTSNVLCLIGTIQAEAVDASSGQNWWNFTKSSGTCELIEGTAVGIFYDPAGTNTNNIKLADRAGTFDGTTTRQSLYSEVSNSWVDVTGNDAVLELILLDAEAQGDTTACVDVNFDGDVDICFEDENGDGIADSSPVGVVTSTNGPVTGTGKFLCQFQIIQDCVGGQPTNDDPTTNGIGYILYFVILFGLLALLGSILRGNIVGNYGLMFAVAIVVGSAGMVYAFGFLDNTLFLVSIFIVIAIAGTKISAMILQNRQGGE